MTQTITGLFDHYDDARTAVGNLAAAGVPSGDVSLVASNAQGHLSAVAQNAVAADKIGEDAGRGAGLGAIVGGTGGLLAGLGLLVIPGIGPAVAVGWLAATSMGLLGGAAIGGVAGAAAGGIVGAMITSGVPDDEAHAYAEGVRRGGTLVSARVADHLVTVAKSILSAQHTVDITERGEAYRAGGWSHFDPAAPPYSSQQAAEEHERLAHV